MSVRSKRVVAGKVVHKVIVCGWAIRIVIFIIINIIKIIKIIIKIIIDIIKIIIIEVAKIILDLLL